MIQIPATHRRSPSATTIRRRHEIFDAQNQPREVYRRPFQRLTGLRPTEMKELKEHMEAIFRELGVQHGSPRDNARHPWACDPLPHIFSTDEWSRIVNGIRQRLTAFELFLQDVYGPRRILRDGAIPIHLVLGSPTYLSASIGLPIPREAYLHLCGICLTRDMNGEVAVKEHQFSLGSGIAYMMQNRRTLARVLPGFFEENTVYSLSDTPLAIGEALRNAAPPNTDNPSVVLLSPGPECTAYYEHGFIARRTGISLVQGDDLLVLDDHLYLKTVRGLKRVDVVYNRIADALLDPLLKSKSSTLGVPGLVHCIRRGTVNVVNAIGSQLADDRSLLHFAPQIIRYYLNESPILPTLPTYWLGDIDQREMVLGRMDDFRIEPVSPYDRGVTGKRSTAQLPQLLQKESTRYVAQPLNKQAVTLYYEGGKPAEAAQEHIVFALRRGENFDVFPGALTRVFPTKSSGSCHWISKDSWVPGEEVAHPSVHARPRRFLDSSAPSREVTSRVAESFLWMGRYLERAYHQAYLIQTVETLETEELNSAERKLYRPMWNRLLPPLETNAKERSRSLITRQDRYRLVLQPEDSSVISTVKRAVANAESIQEALSPEAWATLSYLRTLFQRARFKTEVSDEECARVALRLTAEVTRSVPQFFAIANRTMLGDDGWRFCEVGEKLERAIITANAVGAISNILIQHPQPSDIQLSALLRLLGTRDAYRRIFQMRAEPTAVLEVLWQHPEAPRSVLRCLATCLELLTKSASLDSPGSAEALSGIDSLIHRIRRIDWSFHVPAEEETESTEQRSDTLTPLLNDLLTETLHVHDLISDGFLSHQAYIVQNAQPLLQGFHDGV